MIELPSGWTVPDPGERLARFCAGEYIYYDGIVSVHPDRIEPVDVLATVAVNARVDTATKVYRVHQGMRAACEPLLPSIPQDADLVDLERWRDPLEELLHAAVQVPGVLVPVATKVLHRKRRYLIPMLDNVVLEHYFRRPGLQEPMAASQSKARAAAAAMRALDLFRSDLVAGQEQIASLRQALKEKGFELSPVRILEILLWTQVEPRGGYRADAGA